MTHHWGYVGAVTSALLFGLGATFNKIALADVNPTVAAGLTYLFAGVALSVVRFSPFRSRVMRLLKTPTPTEASFCRRDVWVLFFVVLSGSMLAPLLYMNGLRGSSAVNASLLLNAETLFTVLIAVAFLREHTQKKDWLGVSFLVLGAVFITTNAQFSNLTLSQSLLGNVLIIAACLFWGIDNNVSKLLCFKEDLLLVTVAKCLLGGCTLLLISFVLNLGLFVPLSALLYLLVVGVFSIGFSLLFFMLGLREIGSLRTGAIYSISSLFGALFAFIVLREELSVIQVLAGLLMALGVYILYRK